MTIIRNSSFISANNRVVITNDLLVTAAGNGIIRTNDAGIITSDRISPAFHYIGNIITITDNFRIAAVSNFIALAGNIRVDIRDFRVRIGNDIVIIICQSYAGDASCEDEGSEGGDG